MFKKPLALISLLVLSAALAIAQDAPKTDKNKAEKKLRDAFTIAIGGGGSYLGIHMKEVTSENYSKFGLSGVQGVAVSKVVEDSPAAKAGIKENDVLIRVNGESVTSVRKLRRLISEIAPDHTAKVTVLRGGSERTFDVKMGKRRGSSLWTSGSGGVLSVPTIPRVRVPRMPKPPRGVGPSVYRIFSGRSIGASVTPLTKQLGEYFGVPEGKGLLVRSVRKDSPAEKAGLKAGDVIVEAEGKELKRVYDLYQAIGDKKEGDVSLKIVRNKQTRTLSVTPEKGDSNFNFFFNDSSMDWVESN